EGKRGFFEAMSEAYDVSKVTNKLGEEFKIMENSFKVHASCRHTHHAMDIMMDLAKESDIQLPDVERINVKTYQVAIDITDNADPETLYAAKFSLQFCTALALLIGDGGVDAFNEDNLWNDKIRQLMKLVNVSVDPEINKQ